MAELGNKSEILVNEVLEALYAIEVRKTQYTTEKNVENVVSKALHSSFNHLKQQYNIGGYLGLKVDIDLGDGQVGIEVKLAKDLNTSGIQRLFGQVLYYSRRVYRKNLIVLIVGTDKQQTQVIKEVQSIIMEQGIQYYYLKVKQ